MRRLADNMTSLKELTLSSTYARLPEKLNESHSSLSLYSIVRVIPKQTDEDVRFLEDMRILEHVDLR